MDQASEKPVKDKLKSLAKDPIVLSGLVVAFLVTAASLGGLAVVFLTKQYNLIVFFILVLFAGPVIAFFHVGMSLRAREALSSSQFSRRWFRNPQKVYSVLLVVTVLPIVVLQLLVAFVWLVDLVLGPLPR